MTNLKKFQDRLSSLVNGWSPRQAAQQSLLLETYRAYGWREVYKLTHLMLVDSSDRAPKMMSASQKVLEDSCWWQV